MENKTVIQNWKIHVEFLNNSSIDTEGVFWFARTNAHTHTLYPSSYYTISLFLFVLLWLQVRVWGGKSLRNLWRPPTFSDWGENVHAHTPAWLSRNGFIEELVEGTDGNGLHCSAELTKQKGVRRTNCVTSRESHGRGNESRVVAFILKTLSMSSWLEIVWIRAMATWRLKLYSGKIIKSSKRKHSSNNLIKHDNYEPTLLFSLVQVWQLMAQ